MNALQTSLARAARELRIQIILNQAIDLSGNCKFVARILFPNFGSSKGTMVFSPEEMYTSEQLKELQNLGFGYSSFYPPGANEEFNIESYIEMFSDWSWNGPDETRPQWLLEQDDSDM